MAIKSDSRMLQNYLVSYVPNMWENTSVSREWVQWYKFIDEFYYEGPCTFTAPTIDEFVDEFKGTFPFLNRQCLVQLYESKDETTFFAGPSLLVKKSYHRFYLRRKANNEYHVGLKEIKFTEESYTDSDVLPKWYPYNNPLLFEKESDNYSQKYWGNILQCLPKLCLQYIEFVDPKTSSDEIFKLYAWTDDNLHTFNHYNEKIKFVTHDKVISDEIRQDSALTWVTNGVCIHDGSGLTQKGCQICPCTWKSPTYLPMQRLGITEKIRKYLQYHNDAIIKKFKLNNYTHIYPSALYSDKSNRGQETVMSQDELFNLINELEKEQGVNSNNIGNMIDELEKKKR